MSGCPISPLSFASDIIVLFHHVSSFLAEPALTVGSVVSCFGPYLCVPGDAARSVGARSSFSHRRRQAMSWVARPGTVLACTTHLRGPLAPRLRSAERQAAHVRITCGSGSSNAFVGG